MATRNPQNADIGNVATLGQMMTVAIASMELWSAELATANCRDVYIAKIHRYEAEYGRVERNHPNQTELRNFTAESYQKYKAAKRKVYTAKSKLKRECGKLARVRAERAT